MATISPEMILGAHIVDVFQSREIEDAIDIVISYFTVDRGFSFAMPFAEEPWETCDIPENADRLEDVEKIPSFKVVRKVFGLFQTLDEEAPIVVDIVKRIKARTIAGVCCRYDREFEMYYPFEGFLILDDGSQVFNTTGAPLGTGAAGLYLTDKEKVDEDGLVDYFTVPFRSD